MTRYYYRYKIIEEGYSPPIDSMQVCDQIKYIRQSILNGFTIKEITEKNENSAGVVNLSNVVRRRLCEHHPDVDYKNEWGCPRCLAELRRSLEFYKTRTNEIQKYQKELPEPHRTVICNILANGRPSA